jgi:hypothetical protein
VGTTGQNNTGSYPIPPLTVLVPAAPCAESAPTTIIFPLGLFNIPLQDVQVGATYVGDPATNLINGEIRGFISETDANGIVIPPDIILVGGQTLSSLLAGGTGNCQVGQDDRDTGPGSVSGWYLYINFTAHRVTWTGP